MRKLFCQYPIKVVCWLYTYGMNGPEQDTCRATIFSGNEDAYGYRYREHFSQQYKLIVESVNYTSDLKLKLNTFFLTANTALVTAIGLGFSSQKPIGSSVWHLLLPLAGALMAIIWWGVTYSYKQRNIVKLRIVHCLEEQLPLALYKTEWTLMEENHSHPLKKFLFSIDLFIPIVFFICYLLFAVFS